MRIERIEIGEFGRLTDYTLDLGDGLQVLHGDNEGGKTTLISFLKLMFYGKADSHARTLEGSLRRRYTPWSGAPMGGAVQFACGGRRYRLQKRFGETAARDSVKLLDLETGAEVTLGRNEEAGKRFFGLDLASFERSSFIGRVGAVQAGAKGDELTQRLAANLAGSGDETLDPQSVLARLKEAEKKLVSARGKGQLDEARQSLAALREEKALVDQRLEQQKDALDQFDLVRQQIRNRNELQRQLEVLQAKEELDRLSQLEQRITALQQTRTALSRLTLPIQQLPVYLEELELLMQEYAGAESAARSFGAGDETAVVSSAVSPESRTRAGELGGQIDGLDTLIRQTESELPAAVSEWGSRKSALDGATAELKRCRAEAVALEPFDAQAADAQARCDSVRQELNNAMNEPTREDRRTPAGKRGYLVGAGVLAVAGGAAAYALQQPLLLLILLSALLLLWLGFRGRAAGSDARGQVAAHNPRIVRLQEELDAAERDLAAGIEHRRLLQATREKVRAAEQVVFRAQTLLETAAQHYAATVNRLTALALEPALQGMPLPAPPAEPAACDVAALLDDLRGWRQDLEGALGALLADNGCRTREELEAAFLTQQSDAKNRVAAEASRQLLRECRNALLAKAAVYREAATPDEARAVAASLRADLERLREQEALTRQTARDLGLDEDVPAGAVSERRARLQPLADTASEGDDAAAMRRHLEETDGDALQEQLLQLQGQLHAPDRSPDTIAGEIRELEATVADMEAYRQSLRMAWEVMAEAVDELRRSFSPSLNLRTGEILGALTGNRYDQVLVADDYAVQVRSGLHYREYAYLSGGTVDQVYLSLRLAVAELVHAGGDPPPLILDDVLMQYDDERAAHTLRFLKDYASGQSLQAMLFTCHNHIAEKASGLNIPCTSIRVAVADGV